MSDFKLDTSGFVMPLKRYDPKWYADRVGYEWSDLAPCEQQYILAMFESVWGDESFHANYPGFYTTFIPPEFSDLAPETLELIKADCARALADNRTSQLIGRDGGELWRLRQANLISSDDPQFPPLAVEVDDNGKVRFQNLAHEGERSEVRVNPNTTNGEV